MLGLLDHIIANRRNRGLPKGSPLSPFLMNIFCDHFVDRPWRDRHPETPLLRAADDLLLVADDESAAQAPYRQDAEGNSVFFYGTKGMMTIGRGGVQVFGENNKLVSRDELSGQDDAHQRDFLDAIKEGRRPNADIEVGHLSSSLCHLGNIVARFGRAIRFDPKTEQVVADDEANALLGRKYREHHWAVPEGAHADSADQ